jgi:bifunctional DNA-binding transcriptional regulator/antitoxin component of YhaV-PrlF toxin-antitoxin module
MKLQKQAAYKYKDKTHHKYVIIIPENIVNELGWKEGQELNIKIEGKKLVMEN